MAMKMTITVFRLSDTTYSGSLLPTLQINLLPPYLEYRILKSRQEVPPKHREQATEIHGITCQKTIIFTILFNNNSIYLVDCDSGTA